jgi:DNA-binding SARP family transcriptional activator
MFNILSVSTPPGSPSEALNNGNLPFVGRHQEIELLHACWKRSLHAQGLQAALVIGEAGIGKSRLVERFTSRLQTDGATVVHTKLPVDSTAPLAPYILRACHAAGIKERKGEPAGSISHALRRHVQMRPTVVVIEDIDLLRGPGLYDFALFLESLADERMLLVTTARPACQGARGVLEQYPLEEISLRGLAAQELQILLGSLFGESFDVPILDQLEKASLGNPLAVRSALRGMVRSGALRYDPTSERWMTTISGQLLAQALRQNVELLLQGMTVPLGPGEREAAAQLALLGRTFSRRTADSLVDASDVVVERLIQTGLASPSHEIPASLSGEEENSLPITFTHTLVHRFLCEQATLDPHRLLQTVSQGLPLFSPLPFQHLSRMIAGVDVDEATIRTVVMRALDVAAALDQTIAWQGALPLWESASLLALSVAREGSTPLRDELETILLGEKILLMRRSSGDDGEIELAHRVLETDSDAASAGIDGARLAALGTILVARFRNEPDLDPESVEPIALLLRRHPALLFSRSFIHFADQLMRAALESFDAENVARATGIITWLGEPAGVQPGALLPSLLHSPVAADAGQQAETATRSQGLPFRMPLVGMGFLLHEGSAVEAITLAEHAAPYFRELGLLGLWFESQLNRLALQAGFGLDPEEIDRKIDDALSAVPFERRSRLSITAHLALLHLTLLRGDRALRERIGMTEAAAAGMAPPLLRMMLATADGNRDEVMAITAERVGKELPIHGLVALLHAGSEQSDAAIDCLLEASPTNLLTLLEQCTTIDLVVLLTSGEIPQSWQARIRLAIVGTLGWLSSKGYSAFMIALLDRYERFLVRKEVAQWRSRAEKLATEFRVDNGAAPEGPEITISMLESIQIFRRGEEPQRMRGARLSVVLGLLVADQMLDTPLSYREFCQLASDGESNPDRARDTVNGAVYRLRGLLGADAILTDAETPRLNRARVHVDLIEAYSLLALCNRTMNEGALMHAIPPLLKALRIVGGRVPFPGLYDNFFEANREDFEHRLRTTVIAVAGRLMREGEIMGAEEALRVAFEGMPEDEEIAGLLCDAMTMLGKRTEAERVRMRLAKANAA